LGVGAVTVRANWRVTFRFQDRDAYDVEFQRRNKTMRMKNPVHAGALAKANLEELGLSVAVAAKAIKVTRQQLYNVLQARSAVSPEMALRFEKAFGGSAEMWLRMQVA
jgi:addiction module HigA family antidote